MVDALRYGGYSVQEAADGREGLDLALPGGFDLILLDILMPRMDGMQVLEQLTTQGITPTRSKRRGLLRPMPGPTEQLSLFGAASHPILDQLQALDIARMTPLEALTTLQNHGWPGNVRELRNVIQRVATEAVGPEISAADVQLALT